MFGVNILNMNLRKKLLLLIFTVLSENSQIVIEITTQIKTDSKDLKIPSSNPKNSFERHRNEILEYLKKSYNTQDVQYAISNDIKINEKEKLRNDKQISNLVGGNVTSNMAEQKKIKSDATLKDGKPVKTHDKYKIDKTENREIQDEIKELLLIPTERYLFNSLISNLEILNNIKSNSLKPIKGISVYKNLKTGKYTDFWGKINFTEQSGKFSDKNGFFEGILKTSLDDLRNTSKLDKTGFYVDQKLTKEDEKMNLKNMKKLVNKISKLKGQSIEQLVEKKLTLGLLNDIILYNLYPLKDEDVIEICVCADKYCQNPCEEIRKVERKQLR